MIKDKGAKEGKECNECLGKGFYYEAFSDKEKKCNKCRGTGVIKNDKS